MGSTQIRNAATLAGNLGNASPIGDGGVALLALGARLRLKTSRGDRTVPLEEFYLSYKKTCLQDHEVIAAIEVPPAGALASVVKTAKRGAVDIATVNSAVALTVARGVITSARVALGGVAPTPVLARETMALLEGRAPVEALFREAGAIAAAEVAPISDVRGGDGYRRSLVRNHLLIHWTKLFGREGGG
jgi:xanthine dehydrogenase small subunit